MMMENQGIDINQGKQGLMFNLQISWRFEDI